MGDRSVPRATALAYDLSVVLLALVLGTVAFAESLPFDEPVFIVEEGAPPGFESLDVPEQTFVDVSYGGRNLEPVLATFTADTIRFAAPEDVVDQIPDLLYPGRAVDALRGSLESNAEQLCTSPGIPLGCGVLRPAEAGVIFDRERFHVEIFIGRRLLRLTTINDDERLPPPTDAWSGLATLGGSIAGTSNSDPSYSFRAATLLARGPTRLDFTSDVQTEGRYVVDRLALQHDHRDWEFTGGLYRAAPYRVIVEVEVVGFRARTSLKTRTRLYLDRAYGSRLRIFLLRRSLVQVFRDGRLLVSGVYDVGNQELDTSELPSGAYEVEIRIKDPVSGERSERQFFSKTTELPPLGQIHLSAEAGFLRERRDRDKPLELAGPGLLRFSSAMRINDHVGLDLDLALVDEETIFTFGVLWLEQNFQTRLGPIVTSSGAAGAELFGAFERGPFVINTSLRGAWGTSDSRFIRTPSTDFLFSTAYTWRRMRFGLRADARDRGLEGDPRYSVSPSIQIPLFRRNRLRGDLRFEYTRGDQGNVFFVRVDLVEWFKRFQFSQSVTGRYEDVRGGPRGIGEADLRGRWRGREDWPVDLQTDLRVTRRRDRTSIAGAADLRGNRGSFNGFVEQSFHDDLGPETFYGSQFSIGVVGDASGVSALGDNAGTSAIVVEVAGDFEGGLFDVFVNDARVGRVRVGAPELFPLPPYGEYEVRLTPLVGQSLDYDAKPRRVVLYPGSSARLEFGVRRIFVLIGAVVWPDGEAVATARVEGAVGEAATDESGFLQADVTAGSRLRLETGSREQACLIQVPENPEKEDFVVLDEILCQSAPIGDL